MEQIQGTALRKRAVFRTALIAAVLFLLFGASFALAATAQLVVGNSTKMIAGDVALYYRLVFSGYSVNTVTDYGDITDEVLVVISESTGSRKGAREGAKKYATAKAPIVCLNPLLYGELGMTSTKKGTNFGSAQTNGTMNLRDYYYYIVPADMDLGSVQVISKGGTMTWGVPGDRAILVATLTKNTEKYPFFAYWRGSPMPGYADGAPAKRVGLFIARNVPQKLTEAGWTLFDAAVVWAGPSLLATGGTATNGPVLPSCTDAQMVAYCTNCQADANYGCCTKTGGTTCLSEDSWDKNCDFTACSSACDGACDARHLAADYTLSGCTADSGPNGACLGCADNAWCCKLDGSCFSANTWCPFNACGAATKCVADNLCVKKPITACPTWTHKLTFVNKSSETIWLGVNPSYYAGRTKRFAYPSPGGWKILANGSADVTVPSCWSGNFFIRTGCTFDKNKGENCTKEPCCKTGNCKNAAGNGAFTTCTAGGAPPATLMEFTFDGGLDSTGKKIAALADNYDVSLVDGWTKMVTIVPNGTNWKTRTSDDRWCTEAGCGAKPTCPTKLTDSSTGYCWSPCKYSTVVAPGSFSNEEQAKYCCVCSATTDIACDASTVEKKCSGAGHFGCSPYSEPGQSHTLSQCCPFSYTEANQCIGNKQDTTRVWDTWAQQYITNIKSKCSKAYTWQYDDKHAMFKCQASTETAVNYTITITNGSTGEE